MQADPSFNSTNFRLRHVPDEIRSILEPFSKMAELKDVKKKFITTGEKCPICWECFVEGRESQIGGLSSFHDKIRNHYKKVHGGSRLLRGDYVTEDINHFILQSTKQKDESEDISVEEERRKSENAESEDSAKSAVERNQHIWIGNIKILRNSLVAAGGMEDHSNGFQCLNELEAQIRRISETSDNLNEFKLQVEHLKPSYQIIRKLVNEKFSNHIELLQKRFSKLQGLLMNTSENSPVTNHHTETVGQSELTDDEETTGNDSLSTNTTTADEVMHVDESSKFPSSINQFSNHPNEVENEVFTAKTCLTQTSRAVHMLTLNELAEQIGRNEFNTTKLIELDVLESFFLRTELVRYNVQPILCLHHEGSENFNIAIAIEVEYATKEATATVEKVGGTVKIVKRDVTRMANTTIPVRKPTVNGETPMYFNRRYYD